MLTDRLPATLFWISVRALQFLVDRDTLVAIRNDTSVDGAPYLTTKVPTGEGLRLRPIQKKRMDRTYQVTASDCENRHEFGSSVC
jgi:hypothetical protein